MRSLNASCLFVYSYTATSFDFIRNTSNESLKYLSFYSEQCSNNITKMNITYKRTITIIPSIDMPTCTFSFIIAKNKVLGIKILMSSRKNQQWEYSFHSCKDLNEFECLKKIKKEKQFQVFLHNNNTISGKT